MSLVVRDVFATLQGEGSRAGQPAVFVRLTGCNLWTGLRRGDGDGDCAGWCDTDFASGQRTDLHDLAAKIITLARGMRDPLIVFSGGEPMLQLGMESKRAEITEFLGELSGAGFTLALETNGTRDVPAHWFDHVTVSPKSLKSRPGTAHLRTGLKAHDLKIVVPCPMDVKALVALYGAGEDGGPMLYFQPKDVDGDVGRSSFGLARELAELHGGRVSIQTHKIMEIP